MLPKHVPNEINGYLKMSLYPPHSGNFACGGDIRSSWHCIPLSNSHCQVCLSLHSAFTARFSCFFKNSSIFESV